MRMLKQSTLAQIRYTKKSTGEVTERTVIPTFVPLPNIKAIDVTDMEASGRQYMAELYGEYTEYYKAAAKTLFTFEDWLSHTQGETAIADSLKWRTFVLENTEVLD